MTVEELIEQLQALPGSAATALVVLYKFEGDDVMDYDVGEVHYAHGVVRIEIGDENIS